MKKLLRGIRRHEALLDEGGRFCGVAAAVVGSAVVGGAVSSSNASKAAKAAQAGSTTKQSLDPRMDNILLGGATAPGTGLVDKWALMGRETQPEILKNYGYDSQNYLAANGTTDMNAVRGVGQSLLAGNAAPQSTFGGAAPTSMFGGQATAAAGAQINAPAQNSLNLASAQDKMINGNAGANPYLTSSLQAGASQANAAFNKTQSDLTNNFQKNILGSIRSGAIGAGQYGGSRQAIVEGNAISDLTNQLSSAATQQGLANSANMIGAQANSFNAGQDRSLSALNNLSGQQYSTATTNAQLQQTNNQFNSNLQQHAMDQNQANNQFNSNLIQQNNQMAQQNNQFNAGQQTTTNQQNNAAALSGAGLLSSQLGTAYNNATASNNYDINRAQQVSGLLYPMIGAGASSNSTQPYYSNTAGNAIGGALGGLSLYNQFSNMGGTGAQDLRNSWSGADSNFQVGAGSGAGYDVSAGTAPTSSLGFWGG